MKKLLSLFLFFIISINNFLPSKAAAPIFDHQKNLPKFYELEVWVTAYSSSPEETDDDPFITASGKEVREGIIASNFLSFGTKVKIPEIFGDKIFIVEDRLHPRKKGFIDIWMPTKELAQQFGIVKTKIQVLQE